MSYSAKISTSLLLPKLKEGGNDVRSTSSGVWEIRPPDTYQIIASSIDLGGRSEGQQLRNVTSIPNVWARGLLMESAMHNHSYPQRNLIIEQWRGMLAAFALAELRQFDIKAKLIQLGSNDPKISRDRFVKSLYKLLPEPTYTLYDLNGANPWQDLYVFLWEGRSVGISSPSTLVCHAEDGDWTGLPWFRDKHLYAPSKSDLNIEEKALLCRWLDNLIIKLPEYGGSDDARSTITSELASFRDFWGNVPSNVPLSLSDKNNYFGDEINRGALGLLNKPVKALPKDSSTRLMSDKKDVPELLIIDLDLDKQWHPWQKQEIYVYGDKTLASKNLLSDLSDKKIQWKDKKGKSVSWLKAEELFLPELYFIDQPEALTGSLLDKVSGSNRIVYEGRSVTLLLPINPILLEYFDASELVKKLEIIQPESESFSVVEISLNLQLSGIGNESPKRYRYTHRYSLSEKNRLAPIPILEIWPDFQANGWQEYYTFYAEEKKEEPTFHVSFPECIKEQRRNNVDGWDYAWSYLKRFPTHIICHDGATDPKTLGLILLEPRLKVGDTNKGKWKVGVDFGTSFTNVYINKNGDVAKLVLQPLHFSVTDSDPDNRLLLLVEFFATDVIDILELPLSSVLTTRVSSDAVENKQITQVQPHFDGCIYVPTKGSNAKTKESYIKTGLKWSEKKEERVFTKLFLKQLALQISALAARDSIRKIEWVTSFPSAFSIANQNTYFGIWQDIVKELQQTTNIQHVYEVSGDNDNTTHSRSESVAVAQYFADAEGENLVYSTCVDVGGGTSDISIWEDNNLLHQCSIRLAGNSLLTQFLELNSNILIEQFQDLHYVDWKKAKGTKFAVELDFLLRRNGAEWLKNNRDTLLSERPQFQGLLQLTALGASGIYYYIGMILNVLHSVERKYKRGELTPIYLGGNGANFWHWLSEGGSFDAMREINGLFNAMLAKGSTFSSQRSRAVTRLSSKLKDEVACGLVLNDTKLDGWAGKDWTREPLIAGEYCSVNGVAVSPYQRLPISGNIQISNFEIPSSLAQLRKFVNDFNEATDSLEIFGINPIDGITDEDYSDAHRELQAILLTKRGKSNEIKIEPPFILALNALLLTLGKKWASKK